MCITPYGYLNLLVHQDFWALKLQTIILDCFSKTFNIIPRLFVKKVIGSHKDTYVLTYLLAYLLRPIR